MTDAIQQGAQKKLLTETELELMNLLWHLGEGSVRDVISALPQDRKLAYTSVSTMLRILEQKGVVVARKVGRGHVYKPQLVREEYQARSVHHLVDKVFDGASTVLVRRLLDSRDLSDSDLKAIQAMLDERLD